MTSDVHNEEPIDAIAVIGMSCRLPGASDASEFWSVIEGRRCQLTHLDVSELLARGVPRALVEDPCFVPVTGLVKGYGSLDEKLFRIAPNEARLMDPQQRLFLELCHEALENAGCDPSRCAGDIGLFAGGGRHAYLRYLEPDFGAEDFLDGSIRGLQGDLGNYGDFLATRVSYKLGLTGPSLNIQTACSTSLVTVHMACQSLLVGECDIALAGGVNLHVPQHQGYWYDEGSMCSPDGTIRPFDACANGSVFGNGGGVVVLKRLSEALESRDHIVAVVRGSAINNDASEKMSFTAPSPQGQAEVIARALAVAQVEPADVGYIEAHGTGTILGDPIEVSALATALSGAPAERCALGAVKAQIGHLGPAAGIASFIKAALVVNRGVIPACVGYAEPNPKLHLDKTPFYIPTSPRSWAGRRIAGVSAFGVGGTNAHAIVEAPPAQTRADARPRPRVFVVSAHSEEALRDTCASIAAHLDAHSDVRPEDAAFVLATGRQPRAHRFACVADSASEAAGLLRARDGASGALEQAAGLSNTFAFPGLGGQYVDAGRDLYVHDEAFRNAFEQCAAALERYEGWDLARVLHPDVGDRAQATERLVQPKWGQPAIFAIEYSLAVALLKAGVQPTAMIGHSVGEYAAACLSGVFDVETAMRLVAARGRLMGTVDAGAMMAIGLPEDETRALLPSDLDIAGINAPNQTVVSGTVEAIEAFKLRFEDTEVLHTVIETSVAAHSAMMDSIVDAFAREIEGAVLARPTGPIYSTLTGTLDGAIEMRTAEYWIRHLREPVRFLPAARELTRQHPGVVVEVGPGRGLAGMINQAADGGFVRALTPLLKDSVPSPKTALQIAAEVWAAGGTLDWGELFSRDTPHRIPLPGVAKAATLHWAREPQAAPSLPPRVESQFPPPIVHTKQWLPEPLLDITDESAFKRYAVVSREPADDPIVDELRAQDRLVAVRPSASCASVGEVVRWYTEDCGGLEDMDGVVFSTLGASIDGAGDAESLFWEALNCGVAAARVAEQQSLVFATSGRFLLPGDDTLNPYLSLLAGAARVLPQEYPSLDCIEIDFDHCSGAIDIVSVVDGELAQRCSHVGPVGYRRLRRFVRGDGPAAEGQAQPPWRRGGRYLITGGLGGIGRSIAEAAAQCPGVQLVLTHRAPLPEGREAAHVLSKDPLSPAAVRMRSVRKMRDSGAKVRCVRADVADEVAMRRIRTEHGPFDGVVHAAGVASGHLIDRVSPESVSDVLRPKVRGTLVLDEVVADENTSWVAYCSSVASVVGGLGHADYCAANAFLDAHAEQRQLRGLRTVSLGYDAWSSVGMAEAEAARSRAARSMVGVRPDARLRPIPGGHFFASWAADGWFEYHGWLSEADWLVDEHRLEGSALLPGTGILELLRAACAQALGWETLQLSAVDLSRPLHVPAGERMQYAVTVERGERSESVVLLARVQDAWHVVAQCEASKVEPADGPALDLSSAYASVDLPPSSSLHLGPRWNCLRGEARVADDELHTLCELSLEFEGDLESYSLHPALLDVAAGAFLRHLRSGQFLPYSYEQVCVYGRMPATVRSRIRLTDVSNTEVSFDVDVCREDGGRVLELRCYRLRSGSGPVAKSRESASTANRMVVSRDPGDLESLRFIDVERNGPQPHEVEVQVLATGLNFKEVLMASDLLPGSDGRRYGIECAGIVTQVGVAVSELQVGDPVVAIGESCFADYACLDSELVHRIPPGLSFAEAATLPTAFATAFDALLNEGRLSRGERVLIHAAAGGVGSAALQVARSVGAEAWGTAGSEQKRTHVREQGATSVFDSRTLQFEDGIVAAGGVDVVLNSLAGEYVPAGLRCLKPRGRFVELGRRDIVEGTSLDLSLLSSGVAFVSYYPDPKGPQFRSAFASVLDQVRQGKLTPLPYTAFGTEKLAEAFEYMARARHTGKVVVVRPGASQVVGRTAETGISPRVGVQAFNDALASQQGHVLAGHRGFGSETASDMVVAHHALEVSTDQVGTRRPAHNTYVEPEGETESTLAGIWADVLSLDRVGRADEFLELGGDSLYATQVAARIKRAFDVRMSPSALLGAVALHQIAADLDRARVAEA